MMATDAGRMKIFAVGVMAVFLSAYPHGARADQCLGDKCVSFTCILPMGETYASNCGGGPFIVKPHETASVLVTSSKTWWSKVTATFYVYDAEQRQIAEKTVPAGSKPPLAIFTNDSDKGMRITFGLRADHSFEATITGSFWGIHYPEKAKK